MHAQVLEIDKFMTAPVFAQLVHNTDDDSLLLLIITDFKELEIKEIHLGHFKQTSWKLLTERYGNGNAIMLSNVNTLFLTLEFKNMLKRYLLKLDKNLFEEPLSNNDSLEFDSTLNSHKTDTLEQTLSITTNAVRGSVQNATLSNRQSLRN